MLLVGWAALPHPWLWTAVVLAVLLLPALATALTDLLRKPDEAPIEQHLVAVARTAQVQFAQALLALAWLPYEAFYSVDAIVRTLWRTLISHRRLLEWKPSSIVERQLEESHGSDLAAVYQTMWIAPAIAVLTWTVMPAMNASALRIAAPILVAVAGVARAGVVDQPAARAAQRRSVGRSNTVSAQAGAQDLGIFRDLRQRGRQLAAAGQCAGEKRRRHRASHVADQHGPGAAGRLDGARLRLSDGRTVRRRARRTRCAAMQSLERHRGHFFNWYDTRTLAPLTPRYISTVDSGNLVGSLLTLRVGLAALADEPIVHRKRPAKTAEPEGS